MYAHFNKKSGFVSVFSDMTSNVTEKAAKEERFHMRIPKELKEDFERCVGSQRLSMSEASRILIHAFCDAVTGHTIMTNDQLRKMVAERLSAASSAASVERTLPVVDGMTGGTLGKSERKSRTPKRGS